MAADIYTVDESSLSHRILGIGFFDMKFVREASPKKKEEKICFWSPCNCRCSLRPCYIFLGGGWIRGEKKGVKEISFG
jgi:hypothetical protein